MVAVSARLNEGMSITDLRDPYVCGPYVEDLDLRLDDETFASTARAATCGPYC
jgi:hypothetical protein